MKKIIGVEPEGNALGPALQCGRIDSRQTLALFVQQVLGARVLQCHRVIESRHQAAFVRELFNQVFYEESLVGREQLFVLDGCCRHGHDEHQSCEKQGQSVAHGWLLHWHIVVSAMDTAGPWLLQGLGLRYTVASPRHRAYTDHHWGQFHQSDCKMSLLFHLLLPA
jgi:hypothetical protein